MSTAELLAEYSTLTVQDYLAGETESEVRHEYFGGGVRAMAGASDKHELVAGNLFAALHAHLRGGPCQIFKDGMKVRLQIRTEDVFYYPDIMAACDPTDAHRYFRERPKLIVEVLSEDKNRDRVEKYLAYQRIASLEEYAIISQDPDAPKIEIFRKEDNWDLSAEATEGEFTLKSVGFTGVLGELYS